MPARPGKISRVVLALIWLVVGGAMVAVTVWVGWTRWEVILSGHPAMLVVGMACGLFGLMALAWAVATLLIGDRQDEYIDDPTHPRVRTPLQLERRARRRILLAIPALIVCVLTVGLLAWARPFPAAASAIASTRSSAGVRVTDTLTWYELAPTKQDAQGRLLKPTIGLVFVPGARVDPRAYARILAPVAQAGYLVIVLKEPFGLAVADPGHAGRAMAFHPEITSWVLGGHSLGGVVAARAADARPSVKGLLLYASYPGNALKRADLKVVSISGSADGLTTPAEIDSHKPDLPPSTRYVVIPGGIHAFFGDYGDQPGDGTAGIDRAAAQTQIVSATQALLVSFLPPPAKKKK